MRRRDFLELAGAAALFAALRGRARADVPVHAWEGWDFGPGPAPRDRLDQGPFGVEQDQGWFTIATTTPAAGRVRNFGAGLVGYTWEENGPALAVRAGAERLERAVEKLASLPFVDVLYLRCDWRDVQKTPGRLDPIPVWKLTLEAARRHGLRVAFRVQMSTPERQPEKLAIPDFLKQQVPLVNIGPKRGVGPDLVEPRYDHPAFQKAFRGLVELLAARFDGDPLVEFVDLMMYGFWGEGHTSDRPHPLPDAATAERTFLAMTRLQLDAWKRVPLVVNTQPDISRVGNHAVQDLCVRAGCWLRSDSVIVDEPIQIEALSHRPAWLAVALEDGAVRHHRLEDADLVERTALHALDLGANYWGLWTEADALAALHARRPEILDGLGRRLGYRVRPSWIWQRKRQGTHELVVAVVNDGVAGVPGVLRVFVETLDRKVRVGGSLDAGRPHAGRTRQASFLLPRGLGGKKLRLRAELEVKGRSRPIRWACAEPLEADGALVVETLTDTDKRWRKNI